MGKRRVLRAVESVYDEVTRCDCKLCTSELLHDIKVFQVEQLPDPGVVGEVVHGEADHRVA